MESKAEKTMRQTCFRGLRADGKWLFGDLIHDCGKVYIADDTITTGNGIKGHSDFEVEAGTIGEYTGKREMFDRPIYTGDIVESCIKGRWFYGIVEYSEAIAGYCLRLILKGKRTDIFTAIAKDCLYVDNIHLQKRIKVD